MISPESQGGPNIALISIICSWTFLVIAVVYVGLLLWSRSHIERKFCLDDYLTAIALVITIALISQTTWAIVDEDQDRHEGEISKEKFNLVVKSLLVNQTLWGLVNTLIRINAVLFIYKIFWVNRLKWLIWSLLVLCIIYGLVVLLEAFLICRPMAVDWSASVDGTCGDQIVSYLTLEALGLLLDSVILAVPFPLIWRLQMYWKRELMWSIVFSVGVLVFIISGLRLQALRMVNAQDFTYSKGYLGLLSAIGASLEIICICVPASNYIYRAMRGVLQKFTTPLDIHVEEGIITAAPETLEKSSMPLDIQVEEGITAAAPETLEKSSISMTEDRLTQNHGTDAPSHLNLSPESFDAWLKSECRLRWTPDYASSLPMTQDTGTQTHDMSGEWSKYFLSPRLHTLLESRSTPDCSDEEHAAATSGTPDEISLLTAKDKATQTHGGVHQRRRKY